MHENVLLKMSSIHSVGCEKLIPLYPSYLMPWGGGYEVNFLRSFISQIFSTVKTYVNYKISRLYLTVITAAELRRHLPNMNVIYNI